MYQKQLTFEEAVKRALTVNYCNFQGRSSRSEYWWYCLFTFVLGFILGLISETLGGILSLALLLPGLGLGVRRLHDLNRSGWFLLLAIVPLVNLILIYWFTQPSDPQANQYGPVPNMTF